MGSWEDNAISVMGSSLSNPPLVAMNGELSGVIIGL